jgi:hypothetical protein
MMEKRPGHYLGTEIGASWWRRYRADGFFARGNGELWLDEAGLWFSRFLTSDPLRIPFGSILRVKVGTTHAGRWILGRPIVKVLWEAEGLQLCSGFVVSTNAGVTQAFVNELSKRTAGM